MEAKLLCLQKIIYQGMNFLVNLICSSQPESVGVYRLSMKAGSDNYRESAVVYIADQLASKNIRVLVYEPSLCSEKFNGSEIVNDIQKFKDKSDLILANRMCGELSDVHTKVFTRDIYGLS